MAWTKTPPEIIAAFDKAVPKDPRVVRRPMFGYPAVYLNGNMFAGTYQEKVVVRLPEAQRERATKTAGAAPFEPMPGHRMKEYVVLPAAVVGKPVALAKWIAQARDHAATLPEKAKAKAKPKVKAKTTKAAGAAARR